MGGTLPAGLRTRTPMAWCIASVKPQNVWLAPDGTAKIGDFGLAVAEGATRVTAVGTMIGTVAYMPPEQSLGRGSDARSDIYSLGALLYELLCGIPPSRASQPPQSFPSTFRPRRLRRAVTAPVFRRRSTSCS